MERKQQIRADLKEKRNSLTKEQVTANSARICEKLMKYIISEDITIIYCYYPLGNEVNLLALAEQLLADGRTVAFPRTKGNTMEFYQVNSLGDFSEGAFHIMEPMGDVPMAEEKPLVLVPGLGFDKSRNRIGYGKGFYDRYFARFPACKKVGVGYELQILQKIPADNYDIPMDFIVTEQM